MCVVIYKFSKMLFFHTCMLFSNRLSLDHVIYRLSKLIRCQIDSFHNKVVFFQLCMPVICSYLLTHLGGINPGSCQKHSVQNLNIFLKSQQFRKTPQLETLANATYSQRVMREVLYNKLQQPEVLIYRPCLGRVKRAKLMKEITTPYVFH